MCGRTRCTLRADDFPRAYNRIVNNNNNGDGDGTNNNTRYIHIDRYRPRFNVSPGSYLPIVRTSSAQNNETPNQNQNQNQNQNLTVTVECMKWGLIPSFINSSTPPDHYKMFNVRSESISEKASFRRLIPNNRCLVMVEGFYEWKKDGSRKQPYYIHFKNGQPLVFAALYDSWKNSEGEIIHTFTILTTSSSSSFQWIHDRMPVILGSKSSIEAWLHESHSSKYNTVLKPYEDSNLVWYPVTPAMGKSSFDGPECIVEILKDEKNLISKFFAKKGTGKEKDLSPREVSSEEKDQVDSYESLKEEEETSELVTVSEDDNKNNIPRSSLNLEETEKCGTKRDYSEFVATDLKPSTDSIKNEAISRKKGNVRNADQKQPTLLSYFGRK